MPSRLLILSRRDEHVHLNFHPTALTLLEITGLIFVFIFKSILTGLMILIAGTGHRQKLTTVMPKISVSMPFKLTEKDITLYTKATSSTRENIDADEASKALFLSAVTEPCMLLLVAKRGCPIQPLGAVNVRNSFKLFRPELCKLSDLQSAEGAMVVATLASEARIVKRGVEFDLIVELGIKVLDGDTTEMKTVFRQVFTMLQFARIPKNVKLSEVSQKSEFEFKLDSEKQPEGQVQLPWNGPKDWARVCKDYNPIHISSIAAELYGLPGKIAHGNHMAALALAKVERKPLKQDGGLALDVKFKRPVTVPARLDVRVEFEQSESSQDEVTHFALTSGEKVYVQGEYREL
ncbi:hypothetical protein EYR41_005127 [Orbilia oligospora]|uniref:MaoC-like domain-containing protein n=1 Tax=Orbilia oligospora TaxID=2813651 RepID=A0A7C8PXJ6_ORBOL|nr:hypothetical protein TWF751_006081 [Orbilia oligospora]TGJ69057.1 hypothetical protein EYR41_005127 [Orbilia oligospora]